MASFFQYVYLILLALYNKIDFQFFMYHDNYYRNSKNCINKYIFQIYDIHDYDSDVGYDLDIESDIVNIKYNISL